LKKYLTQGKQYEESRYEEKKDSNKKKGRGGETHKTHHKKNSESVITRKGSRKQKKVAI